ncbi:MAG: lysine--tRNA ligase [Alphaproteobacteria bacterium]|nr:lysine--tRNA ligase [Alphaproteobacteria bacterium]
MTTPAPVTPQEREFAQIARAWPFEEARRLIERTGGKTPDKGYVLLETGYGPSGLPHIGTFGEVVRTTQVRQAFRRLSDIPTRMFCFSDDMDGLRKVPDNVPNQDMLKQFLGKPLTIVPDPFGTHESFGHHNNARLRAFLDGFGFDYEFQSATDWYKSGRFDVTLRRMLEHYEAVKNVILPTLGPERRATYSPFLPVCPRTGAVLQVPIVRHDVTAGTVEYKDEAIGKLVEVPVTGGHCKMQWKADWAMRWVALGIDYEMAGKDLIDSVKLSGQIARVLGARPPEGFNYELFLDEKGEKISKSKGNGLTVEQWLTCAPPESLALYMHQQPRRAKRLFFDVIPRAVDEYLGLLEKYQAESAGTPVKANAPPANPLDNPVWHLHDGKPPAAETHLSFGILLNLASVCHAEDKAVLWGFIARYAPNATPATAPILDRLAGHAVAYYRDIVKPAKRYRAPSEMERAALDDLVRTLESLPADAEGDAIQTEVFEVGKRHAFADLRAWFKSLYEILLGQDQGPRMGSFIKLYGRDETVRLIRRVLAGEDLASAS